MVNVLRGTMVALVRSDGPDLKMRQLGAFLTCYLQEHPPTVRGLAVELNVPKSAITRALDRLGELDLAMRKRDPLNGRNMLLQRTMRGLSSCAICSPWQKLPQPPPRRHRQPGPYMGFKRSPQKPFEKKEADRGDSLDGLWRVAQLFGSGWTHYPHDFLERTAETSRCPMAAIRAPCMSKAEKKPFFRLISALETRSTRRPSASARRASSFSTWRRP
jgi:DNA-binding MarR family transcriptional regulator